ncbi:MAG: hypothetical protein JWR33_1219 [Naasia sp.]|uniref:hypothetical protein n=1 Tax=Naasia sp. TaxID=2546198 RepID=UPI002618B478|nr:hypothetical protein [Naasia sp.]MCU1570478.1 hypothetical protein [Naasia sp.]
MQARVPFSGAAAAYTLNCALGTSVALRLLDTREYRWLHHALYISTCVLTGLALTSPAWGKPRVPAQQSALLLAPAVVPLAAIPYLGSSSKRHPIVALTAAPFFVASLIRSWR